MHLLGILNVVTSFNGSSLYPIIVVLSVSQTKQLSSLAVLFHSSASNGAVPEVGIFNSSDHFFSLFVSLFVPTNLSSIISNFP